jgi:hypothetical protein
LLNCQQPRPMGVTIIPVRPRGRKLFIFTILSIFDGTKIAKLKKSFYLQNSYL